MYADAKVKIWSTLPILSEEAEQNDSNPKLLSTLTLHNGMSGYGCIFRRFPDMFPMQDRYYRSDGLIMEGTWLAARTMGWL